MSQSDHHQVQTPPSPGVKLQRVVSPTPSAKKRLSALQQMKKLGAKLKPKSKSKVDPIPEDTSAAAGSGAAVAEETEARGEETFVIEQADIPHDHAPAPATFAERLRILIVSLPTGTIGNPPPVRSDPPATDSDGCPIPPPGAVQIKDHRLVQLLSDAHYMNGTPPSGPGSVWDALDALDVPTYRQPTSNDDTPGQPDGAPGDDQVQPQADVMLYCPLHPTEYSKIELAKTTMTEIPESKVDGIWQTRWNFLWSITVGLVKSQPAAEKKLVKTWVPSTTKVSFHALWWGYRLYLPPPVMADLNSEEAQAIKIATTFTALLTWLLAHVDASEIPVPLLPAFLLVQKLGPYVGYIGTFVAWIWGTINGKDKGNGVCLTATWLLPVALIPSSITPPPPTTTSLTTPPSATPAVAAPTMEVTPVSN